MGLVSSLLGPAVEASYPADHDYWYDSVGAASTAGVVVTAETALMDSTVFRCVSAIAQDVAGMPLPIYRRLPSGGKERDRNHPLYNVLHDQPNQWQTAFEWREMVMGHLLLRGNAYNLIESGPRGFADQLIPLHPGRMRVDQLRNRRLRYTYSWEDGRPEVFNQDEIFHLRGLSSNGFTGLSVVSLARDSFGLGMAAEQYGTRFFSQGSEPRGILEVDGTLQPDARERLKSRSVASRNAMRHAL